MNRVILPSLFEYDFWIVALSPNRATLTKSSRHFGKWLIFAPEDKIDELWKIIKKETELGHLGISSKVSTKAGWYRYQSDYVICCHTEDCRNYESVFDVRKKLFKLGFTGMLEYKTDESTANKRSDILYKK